MAHRGIELEKFAFPEVAMLVHVNFSVSEKEWDHATP
jgi:hypothetical protein